VSDTTYLTRDFRSHRPHRTETLSSCTLLTTGRTDAQMQHFKISSGDGRHKYRVNPLNG
jgi:hypothetical protein